MAVPHDTSSPNGRPSGLNFEALPVRLDIAALIAAGVLVGFGLIIWLAANWALIGKAGRFALVGGIIVVAAAGALASWRLRLPSAILGVLATGGMLALYGQTYQTGIDPWPLFATWALLALPWALVLRHDSLWVLWVLIAGTALQLWLGALLSRSPGDWPVVAGWAIAIAGTAMFSAWAGLSRWLGSTTWSFRAAALLTLALVAGFASIGLFARQFSAFVPLLGFAALSGAVFFFARTSPLYRLLLAGSILALDVFLILALWRSVFDSGAAFNIPTMLLLSLMSAGIVAASGYGLVQILNWRHESLTDLGDSRLAAMVKDGLTIVGKRAEEANVSGSWPVAIVSFVGAVMASVPIIALFGLIFGARFLVQGPGAVIIGMVCAAVGLGLLRARKGAVFVQQLGFIALAVGIALIVYAIFRDLPLLAGSTIAFLLFAGLAAFSNLRWLNLILGLAGLYAALGFVGALFYVYPGEGTPALIGILQLSNGYPILFVGIFAAALLVVVSMLVRDAAADEGLRAWIEGFDGFATGIAGGVLLKAMFGSPTFLVSTPGRASFVNALPFDLTLDVGRMLAVVAVAGALFLYMRLSDVSRSREAYALSAVALVFVYVMPMLALPLLVLLAALTTGRRALAVLAGVATVWIVGSFYFWLGLPLYQKGLILMALGLMLGAALWWWSDKVKEELNADVQLPQLTTARWPIAAIGGSVAILALLIGTGIWQSEAIIANGRQVFVALGPKDPRSLMQGDYMRLAFRMPGLTAAQRQNATRPQWAIAEVADNGVASVRAFADEKKAAGANGLAMRIWFRGRLPVLGTSGFFFAEGARKKYEAARFGVFRVADSGRVILVGLADENLNVIK